MSLALTLGLSLSTPVGGGGAPTSYTGLAATRCRFLTSFISGNKQIMTRSPHVAAVDISSLKIKIANFRLLADDSTEVATGGTMTVTAAVEYSGVFTQIKFAGSASGTCASGAVLTSDVTLGDLGIPAGATFFIRTFVTNPAGIIYNAWRNSAMGEVTNVGASGLSDQTMGGTITSIGNFSAPVQAIIATTNQPSVCIIGDSKSHGFLDTAESATAAGPGLRGEIAKSFPATLPFLNLATGGMRANLWASQSTGRSSFLGDCSHFVINLGHNDIYVSSASAATLKTNIESITAAILAAKPSAKITICTQTHKSTSASGNWTSDADQTASGGNSDRVAYNNIVRALGVTGQNNGLFEIAWQVESAHDNSLWKSDGTNKKYTSDGVHEQPAGYDLIVSSGAVDYAAKFVYP